MKKLATFVSSIFLFVVLATGLSTAVKAYVPIIDPILIPLTLGYTTLEISPDYDGGTQTSSSPTLTAGIGSSDTSTTLDGCDYTTDDGATWNDGTWTQDSTYAYRGTCTVNITGLTVGSTYKFNMRAYHVSSHLVIPPWPAMPYMTYDYTYTPLVTSLTRSVKSPFIIIPLIPLSPCLFTDCTTLTINPDDGSTTSTSPTFTAQISISDTTKELTGCEYTIDDGATWAAATWTVDATSKYMGTCTKNITGLTSGTSYKFNMRAYYTTTIWIGSPPLPLMTKNYSTLTTALTRTAWTTIFVFPPVEILPLCSLLGSDCTNISVTPSSGTYTTSAPSISASISYHDTTETLTGCKYTIDDGATWQAGIWTPDSDPTKGYKGICSIALTGLTNSTTYKFNMKAYYVSWTMGGGMPPIPIPTWNYTTLVTAVSRTVDTSAPASSLTSLAGTHTTTTFPIAFTADDGTGSGVENTELWYKKEGGAYALYDTLSGTSGSFDFDTTTTGGDGNYSFYTRAKDKLGNYQAEPVSPMTTTSVATTSGTNSNTNSVVNSNTNSVVNSNVNSTNTNTNSVENTNTNTSGGTTCSSSAPFPDVTESTLYKAAIEFLKARGIISGYPDCTYKPLVILNRAELLKIVIGSKYPSVDDSFGNMNCFPDVPTGQWYTKYVCFAKSKGIVSGYPDGSFKPDQKIIYVEALKIGLETFGYAPVAATNPWYQGYVNIADAYKITVVGTAASEQLMRGKMAELIRRIIAYAEEGLTSPYLQ